MAGTRRVFVSARASAPRRTVPPALRLRRCVARAPREGGPVRAWRSAVELCSRPLLHAAHKLCGGLAIEGCPLGVEVVAGLGRPGREGLELGRPRRRWDLVV